MDTCVENSIGAPECSRHGLDAQMAWQNQPPGSSASQQSAGEDTELTRLPPVRPPGCLPDPSRTAWRLWGPVGKISGALRVIQARRGEDPGISDAKGEVMALYSAAARPALGVPPRPFPDRLEALGIRGKKSAGP